MADTLINEFELNEIRTLITIGLYQTEIKEMHSDQIKTVLEGIDYVLDRAIKKRDKGTFGKGD